MAHDSSSGSDDDDESPPANTARPGADSDSDKSSVGSLAAHAARMFASLKGWAVDCLVTTIASPFKCSKHMPVSLHLCRVYAKRECVIVRFNLHEFDVWNELSVANSGNSACVWTDSLLHSWNQYL